MKVVKGTFNEAKVFTDNVDYACLDQLKNLLNCKAFEGEKIRIMPDCLTEDAQVLTDKGFVDIIKMSGNEKVANYHVDSGIISFKKVKSVIVRDVRQNENVYAFECKNKGIRITSSENHRNLLSSGKTVLSKDINDSVVNTFVYHGDGRNRSVKLSLDDDEIRLITWIVGDGHFKLNNGDNIYAKNQRYRISFGLKKERKISRVVELLRSMNIGYSIHTSSKQTSIIICTADSMRFFNYLNGQKHFPWKMLSMSRRQAEIFRDELIQVDGDYTAYVKSHGYRYNTTNSIDADFVQALFSINFGLSIKHMRYRRSNFSPERDSVLYYVTLVNDNVLGSHVSGYGRNKLSKSVVEYNGKLCCIECDTTYFIARQNGLTFVTGNCHAGAGCVVGYTQTITTGKVVSNLVGVDIGCGMSYVKIPKVDLRQLDKVIHQFIPAGFEIHKPGELPNRLVNGVIDLMDKLYAPLDETRRARIMNSIGTLGGGNHFLELDTCVETGYTYLVVHTGSRNLGLQVAKYWQSVAEKEVKNHSIDVNAIVKRLKSEGRETEIESEIKKIKSQEVHVPKELSYLEGEFAERYLHDMDLCQKFAEDNRRQILTTVMGKLGVLTKKNEKSIKSTIHNYIDLTRRIIRKGAISAEADEEVLIPMNMRDGSLICVGKGNEDWNYSAPHGAGRIMSRGEAKRNVSMEDYRKSMEGIFSTSISESTIDESPMAYKPAKEIESLIGDTVEVKYHLKPVYNFKAGSEENWSR